MLQVKLVVVGGDAKAAEIPLKLPAVIGRGRDAALALPHPLVSRMHCEIFESSGQVFVRDLGSLNGTFIGSQRITEAPLPPGELLTIGNVTFRAMYGDADLSPPSPTSAAGSFPTPKAMTTTRPQPSPLAGATNKTVSSSSSGTENVGIDPGAISATRPAPPPAPTIKQTKSPKLGNQDVSDADALELLEDDSPQELEIVEEDDKSGGKGKPADPDESLSEFFRKIK